MPKKKTATKKAAKKKAKSFEETLWNSANKLRGSVESAEYKHVVLSLIFLKFASDKFEERRQELENEGKGDYLENTAFYQMKNVFYLPEESRWSTIQTNAKQDDLAIKIDTALHTIEKNNKQLAGALPDNYFSRLALDRSKLASLIDIISDIDTIADKSQDIVGRVYEYFLGKFAAAEGKGKGEFYTPKSVVTLMTEMVEPYGGKVYDPCCGSGGMFVQSVKFVENHQGSKKDISIYGQEYTSTTYKLAKMNLAIRGISGNLGPSAGDTFHRDLHPDLKADYILANPPFNLKDWRGPNQLSDDPRWAGYDMPSAGNANFAWILHIVDKLSTGGTAAFVMVNGTLSSNVSTDGDIRRSMVNNDLVDCIILLPSHLFFNMYSQVCIWILTKNKEASGHRPRKGETLFIDATELGEFRERTLRELLPEDIETVSKTYKKWNGVADSNIYVDVPGFCKAVQFDEIRKKGFNLLPARYVGSSAQEAEGIPTKQRLERIDSRFSPLVETLSSRLTAIRRGHRLLLDGQNQAFERSSSTDETISDLIDEIEILHRNFTETLFDSWFIHFELGVDGEMEIPESVIKECQLPEGFEESPLGDIPVGWAVKTYGDILEPVNEKIGDAVCEEFSATVRGLECRSARFNKKLSKSSSKNKIIRRGEMVFGLSRTTLNFGLMTQEIGSVSPVYEVFSVDESAYRPALLELYIRRNMKLHMDILKSGAREGAPIERDYFLQKELLVPDMKIQKLFCKIAFGEG